MTCNVAWAIQRYTAACCAALLCDRMRLSSVKRSSMPLCDVQFSLMQPLCFKMNPQWLLQNAQPTTRLLTTYQTWVSYSVNSNRNIRDTRIYKATTIYLSLDDQQSKPPFENIYLSQNCKTSHFATIKTPFHGINCSVLAAHDSHFQIKF